MIMDKEQLEKIAEERFKMPEPLTPNMAIEASMVHVQRKAFISGYNYAKQESDGLREEVEGDIAELVRKWNLEIGEMEMQSIMYWAEGKEDDAALIGLDQHQLKKRLRELLMIIQPPHLNKAHD